MNRYQQNVNKALGVAFIVAPLLMLTAAFVFLLGIGVSSYGVSSWLEGVLNAFGFLLLVPVYFALGRMIGKRAPRLGVVCTILCVGIGFGIVPSTDRITQAALEAGGYDVPIFSLFHPGFLAIALPMFLGMFTSIALGIGFLRYGGLPRWTAVLLILAPIIFVMGQGGDESIALWQVRVMYPLATAIWFLALAPIGWRLLNGSADDGAEVSGVQTAV